MQWRLFFFPPLSVYLLWSVWVFLLYLARESTTSNRYDIEFGHVFLCLPFLLRQGLYNVSDYWQFTLVDSLLLHRAGFCCCLLRSVCHKCCGDCCLSVLNLTIKIHQRYGNRTHIKWTAAVMRWKKNTRVVDGDAKCFNTTDNKI